jgi:hypothetical protein
MAALPKIVEEIVSGVLVVFELFHFMWALMMEVACFKTFIYCEQLCNNAVNYPSTRPGTIVYNAQPLHCILCQYSRTNKRQAAFARQGWLPAY